MALVNYPRIGSFGLNIRPASGNKIYIYEAGTTTPKTTYSIPAMTAGYEHLVPVPADDRGVFPAIYTTGLYKIVIKNSLGDTIYTDDNQTGNEGGLQWKGTFSSTTNSSNYPASGDQGDVYLVTETFVLAAASGSHQLVDGDFIVANKNGAAALDADWEIYRGVGTTGVKALTPGATIATDCNDGTVFTVTLDQNSTLSNPTNKIIGKTYEWQITNAAAAIYTLAYGTNFSFPNGDIKIKAEKSSLTIIRGTVISSTVIKAHIVRNRDIGWSAGNLKINVTGNDTASLTADWIKFVSDSGDYVLKENISETLTISTQKSYATTEKASTWHQWHMSVTEAGGTITSKAVPDVAGTADSDSLNNLSCSTADFIGDGITVGSKVYNTTDGTSGFIGATTDLHNLAIVDAAGAALDLFPDGNEAFIINILKPAGFGTYKATPGPVYNNSSSNLASLCQIDKKCIIPSTQILLNGTSATYAAVSFLLAAPITAKKIYFNITAENPAANTAGAYITADPNIDQAKFYNAGFTGATTATLSENDSLFIKIPSVLYYKWSNANITINVTGYEL